MKLDEGRLPPAFDADITDEPASTMLLRCEAISPEADDAVQSIGKCISQRKSGKPTARQMRALAAVLADLLSSASYDPVRPCFRPTGAGSFTKQAVGFAPFDTVRAGLTATDYVEVTPGVCYPNRKDGKVTRILPTPKLLAELARFGITPSNRHLHFADRSGRPLVIEPIQVRGASTRNFKFDKFQGPRMPIDTCDPLVQRLAKEVATFNEYLAKQSYEGMAFQGLFRGFNEGDQPGFAYQWGGRLYAPGGGYQAIERTKRAIKINGERTVEVDISASHLTIFHQRMGVPLPAGDLYAISGFDRYPIKLFVTAALGFGKIPRCWSRETSAKHKKEFKKGNIEHSLTGNLEDDYPFKPIKEAVLSHLPVLNDIESSGYRWCDFQFIESNVLIEAMNYLMSIGIPSLPLHDSLIVPESKKETVREIVRESFKQAVGIYPLLKVKA